MADQDEEQEKDQNEDDQPNMQELDDQDNAENQALAAEDGIELNPDTQPPLTDEKLVPVSDGSIPLDSSGISAGEYNAISPTGEVNIQFQQGNYQQITSLPKIIQNKIQQVTNTLVPLIEVGLIELLGSSSMYRRDIGQCELTISENNQAFIDFTFKYTVDLWVAIEVDQSAISADANYIKDKISIIPGTTFSQITIDCTKGTLTIVGQI